LQQLYEVLYVSTLAPQAPITAISDIIGRARPKNLVRGITGVLVFDGMRFCHAVEGPQLEVLTLMEEIRDDERHTDIRVLHHGQLPERRFARFRLGYTPEDDPDALLQLAALEPAQEIMEQFLALIPQLDLDP
jgi:hypothetical protein